MTCSDKTSRFSVEFSGYNNSKESSHETGSIQRGADHWHPQAERSWGTSHQLCREHGIGESTFYKWKSKYGGLEVNKAKRLRALEEENSKLKRLLADVMLDNAALKDVLSKKW
jgi:putative transposase